ncbi:hypothetical protein Mapa_002757 [Marchantia paleacea]|nr:hypothetical protein Mapa_002757 [Marchantia paleacea]
MKGKYLEQGWSTGAESMDHDMSVDLARLHDNAGEFRLVDGVGESLSFEAVRIASLIMSPSFPVGVQKIAGVELHARRRGENLHHTPGHRIDNSDGSLQPITISVVHTSEHVIVIIAARWDTELGNSCPDGMLLEEIERSALDRLDRPSRYKLVVHRRIMSRKDLKQVVQNFTAPMASQVPVRVARKIHGCGFFPRLRFHLYLELAILAQRVGHRYLQASGKSLLAIEAVVIELNGRPLPVIELLRLPQNFVEAHDPSVERVVPVVCRKMINLAAQFEGGIGNAVGHSTDDGPEVGSRIGVHVSAGRVVAEHDVLHLTSGIGHLDGHHGGPPVGNLHLHLAPLQCIHLHHIHLLHAHVHLVHLAVQKRRRRSLRLPP